VLIIVVLIIVQRRAMIVAMVRNLLQVLSVVVVLTVLTNVTGLRSHIVMVQGLVFVEDMINLVILDVVLVHLVTLIVPLAIR
jgi:hypothetical protein